MIYGFSLQCDLMWCDGFKSRNKSFHFHFHVQHQLYSPSLLYSVFISCPIRTIFPFLEIIYQFPFLPLMIWYILIYYDLLYSVLLRSILFCSFLSCTVLFCSVLFSLFILRWCDLILYIIVVCFIII